MNKTITLVCFLLLPALLFAKQRKAYGKITDDQGIPVANCEIKATHSNDSTFSNAHGEFSLAYNTDSSSALIISCLGYEAKETKITDDALWIILKHKVNKLNDATINADNENGEIKQGILGKRNLEPYGLCADILGSENAILLHADADRHGMLQEVFFYITKEGIPDSKFRVHVYGLDRSFMPGADLLDSNVIVHADKGDEWVRVDVSSRHILIGGGVFISMEWLSGSGNNPNLVTTKGNKEQYKFNSVVLAMTKGYRHQGSSLHFQRSNFYHQWHRSDPERDHHDKDLNPMIYATYTYRKK